MVMRNIKDVTIQWMTRPAPPPAPGRRPPSGPWSFSPPRSATRTHARHTPRPLTRFFTWCDAGGLALTQLSPIAVATYIEEMQSMYRAPTIKQHLAAIRRLFDWLGEHARL